MDIDYSALRLCVFDAAGRFVRAHKGISREDLASFLEEGERIAESADAMPGWTLRPDGAVMPSGDA